tara:strand:- start:73 stop:207 length:135 start_codon:yes stop_codon:yes gene_type:complete
LNEIADHRGALSTVYHDIVSKNSDLNPWRIHENTILWVDRATVK